MTIEATSYVLNCGINDPVEKLAFLALADNADQDGFAIVNYARVADWACCQDEGEAADVLNGLVEKGFITIENWGVGPIATFNALAAKRAALEPNKYPNRETVPPKVRQRVYRRDGYSCHYCDIETDDDTRTLDHIVPVSKGGEHTEENLVVACRSCNSKKGTKDYLEFVGLTQ